MSGSHLQRAKRWKWFVLLVSLEFGALTWLSTLGEIPIPSLWLGYGVAFVSYAIVVAILRKERISPYVMFLLALGLRVPWIPAGLSLSDDAWRYLHDGRSQVAGTNPYRYPPNSPEAREYAGPEHRLINNPDLPTIYPAAAQWAFRASMYLGGTLLTWKVLMLIVDLAVGLGLVMLLVARARSPTLASVYLFHPLPIVEFVGNGHVDVLGICALVFSMVFLQTGAIKSGVMFAISGATKYLTLPLLPFYLRANKQRAGMWILGTFAMLGLLYLPFLDFPPLGSLGTFAATFEFNGPIYLGVSGLFGRTGARFVLALALTGVLIWSWTDKQTVEGAAFVWIGAVLLASPIVHPWYVTWLIPLAVLRDEQWPLVWSGTVVLSYYVLTDWRAEGVWHLPFAVMILEYVPVYLLVGRRLLGADQGRLAA